MRWRAGFYLCIGLLTMCGCQGWKDRLATKDSTLQETVPPRQIEKLREEISTLKSRNMILAARLEEQLIRERRLSKQVNRLKFFNEQQAEQIVTLADAPVERDRFRKQTNELTREVIRMQKRIDELEQALASRQAENPRTTQGAAAANSPSQASDN